MSACHTFHTLLQVAERVLNCSGYGAAEQILGRVHGSRLTTQTCAFVNYIDRTDAIRARDDVLNRLGGHIADLSETAAVRVGFGKIDAAPSGQILNASSAMNSAAPSTASIPAPPNPGLSFVPGSMAAQAGSATSTVKPQTNLGITDNQQAPSTSPNNNTSPLSLEAYGSPSSALATPNAHAHVFGGNPELLPSSGMVAGEKAGGVPPGSSSMPTRALWIGSIPGTTSSATLLQIFSPFGPVESARVLMHKVSVRALRLRECLDCSLSKETNT